MDNSDNSGFFDFLTGATNAAGNYFDSKKKTAPPAAKAGQPAKTDWTPFVLIGVGVIALLAVFGIALRR